MPTPTPSLPTARRLALYAWPVAEMHEFELIYWFRRWLTAEHYLGCAQVRDELRRREAAGLLSIALLTDGFREKDSGRIVFSGMNGLLDAWPARYPELFTQQAAAEWRRSRERARLQDAAL